MKSKVEDKSERAEEICEMIPYQSLTSAHKVLQNFSGLALDGVKNGMKWARREPTVLEKMINPIL